MIVVERQVTCEAPVATVFAYLADFTTTTEWDPGTVATVRVDGDGGVGTLYRNTSRLAGRQSDLVYVVTDLRAPRTITLLGQNRAVVATDTITVEPFDGQTRVTYRAAFEFRGVWRVVAPLLRPAFRRLGNDAEAGLRTALARL
jgi:carbon monoxide dehydrogenase subunit G